MKPTAKPTAPSFNRAWPYAVLGLIVLASLLGNLFWLQQNTVQLGHDASAHLARTLKMAEAMSPLSLGSFLRGLTITDFRPPGLYLAAQPFYWLFGRSIDSAQLANVTILALILVCTFALARFILDAAAAGGTLGLSRGGANALALLATAMTALLPMLVAMARLFYTETLVTLSLVAAVYFLLRSQGFTRRAWCVALGVALGIGLLAKWTLPVYVVLPLLLVAWQSPLRQAAARRSLWPQLRPGWESPGRGPLPWRTLVVRIALAALAAALVAVLLYWPQQSLWANTLLHGWLLPAWFIVWFALFALLLAPSTSLFNLLLALAVAAAIASLWYLPRAGFAFELSDVAFGTGGGDFEVADWSSFNQYFRYFRLFFQHHLGLAIGLLILPAGLLPWLWRGRSWLQALPGSLLLWVATLSPFLLLIATSQTNSRNLVPILPLFAILAVLGLLAYPRRWRYAWATAWLAILLSFWALATFDGLSTLHTQTSVFWPAQTYSVAPASGVTDPDFWIVPDVLDQVTPIVAPSGEMTTTLGVMLDLAPLHSGSFEYDIIRYDKPIDLITLSSPQIGAIADVVTNKWLLIKDGDNRELNERQRGIVGQMLAHAPWFTSLYSLVKSYPFPNGETAYLYRRAAGPADPYQFSTIVGTDLPPVADAIRSWWSPRAALAYATPETAVWLGTQALPPDEHAIIPAGDGDLEAGDLAGIGRTLIVASRYRTSDFQAWLDRQFRYIAEVRSGEFAASLYGHLDHLLAPVAVDAAWPELSIASLSTWPEVRPGDPLPVDARLAGRLDGTWKISARLLDGSGTVLWQQDTSAAGEDVALTLFVPPGTPPGEYTLDFVVYNAATQEVAADAAGRSTTPLAAIKVVE